MRLKRHTDAPTPSAAPQNSILRYSRLKICATPRNASVLVGVLWCVALLSVVVIGTLHTARMDLTITKNHGDAIQAHYLALAGIEHAKALLYHDAGERSRSGNNHTGNLYNAPDRFRDVPLGRGQFRVIRRGRDDEGNGLVFGVSDEESRLNVNVASQEQILKLYGMTPDVAAGIIDWRDGDNVVTPGGAETDYYASLIPPYLPRNGPFLTIRELLMVRGVSSMTLLGEDGQQNGLLIAPGDGEDGPDDQLIPAGDADLGWAWLFCVNSSVQNVSASGQARVNVQTADQSQLTTVQGITTDIARAIVSYRGQRQLESIADLLDVTAASNQNQNQNQNQPQGQGSGGARNNQAPPQNQNQPNQAAGPKVIDLDLLLDIADEITVKDDQALSGAININTAGLDVLMCLPGVDRTLAQAIILYRQSSGYFPNTAWLLKVSGMTPELFKQVAPLITARSETFRILSEGKVNSSGVRRRIQAVVHVDLNNATLLSYREDDL